MKTIEMDRVNNCKNLDQLCELLNEFNGMSIDGKVKITDVIDFASLPLFSRNEPRHLQEVWSYDDTRYLTADDGNNRWGIKPRCPDCGEADFWCKC